MSEIADALSKLKGSALKEASDEFLKLYEDSKKDSLDFIKKSAERSAGWLVLQAQGKLTSEDVRALLKLQKKNAEIFTNTQQIKVRSRIQKLTYRLLDIAIDVLVAAI